MQVPENPVPPLIGAALRIGVPIIVVVLEEGITIPFPQRDVHLIQTG